MIRAALVVGLVLGLGLSAPAAVADTRAGIAAHARGDYAAAAEAWRSPAAEGAARAQYGLGLLHAEGRGVPADPARALGWYTRAAERGFAPAQYNLAVLHERGAGVPRDIAQAVFWYAEAARRDFAPAATNLALAYLDGRGLPRNLEAAVQTLAVATPADRARLRSALPAARVGPARVNLRAGPSLNAAVRSRLAAATPLRVYRRQRGWVEVWAADGERVGWVAERLLRGVPKSLSLDLEGLRRGPLNGFDAAAAPRRVPARGAGSEPPTLAAYVGLPALFADIDAGRGRDSPEAMRRVATPRLNVRAGPGTDRAVVATLSRGATVRVLGRAGGWRRVRYGAEAAEGWVAAFLLAPAVGAESAADTRPAVGTGGG